MGGPPAVPIIDKPDWLAGMQAILSGSHGMALADLQELHALANAVNPGAGTINCGWIIDGVIARFTGSDASAIAPTRMDGSWQEIQQRHNTTLGKSSFQGAFDAVKAAGPGTAALVGIVYPPDPRNPAAPPMSHVVALVNQNGTVAVIEAQHGGPSRPRGPITSPVDAALRYNTKSEVAYGIVGAGAPPPGTPPAWPPPTLPPLPPRS